MARIVVIIPVYNVENYLERCIDSVLNQSFDDFRLILVNDGSTDTSGQICETYRQADERIELINQENMGLSMARNNGLEASSEKYVMFLDSDDYIHRDMLDILYKNLIENGADISVCDHKKVYEGQRLEYKDQENNLRVLSNIEAVEKIVKRNDENMIVAWGKLYNRELFKGISYPEGKYHEDEFVTYRLFYRAKKIILTSAQLHYYIQRDASITGDKYSLKRLEKLEGLKEAIGFFNHHKEEDLELAARYRYLFNIQIAYYRLKFELSSEVSTMVNLKTEYNNEFASIVRDLKKLTLMKRFNLRFFHLSPNLYSYAVKVYMTISKALVKD